MFQDSKGFLWLGGSEGLTRFDGTTFATWRGTDTIPSESILNIVEDQSGTLWLGTQSGVMRMTRADFDAAVADPAAPLRHGFYDSSDGIVGTPRWFGEAERGPRSRRTALVPHQSWRVNPRSAGAAGSRTQRAGAGRSGHC